jgi:hypothetical protein
VRLNGHLMRGAVRRWMSVRHAKVVLALARWPVVGLNAVLPMEHPWNISDEF